MQEAIRVIKMQPNAFQKQLLRKLEEWVTQDRAFARPGIDERCWITNGEQSDWKDAELLKHMKYAFHGLIVFDDPHRRTLALRCRRKDLPKPDPAFPETPQSRETLRNKLLIREGTRFLRSEQLESAAYHLPCNDHRKQPDPIPPVVQKYALGDHLQKLAEERIKTATDERTKRRNHDNEQLRAIHEARKQSAIAASQQATEAFKSKKLQMEQEEFEAAQKRVELRRLVKQQREQRKANQLIEARTDIPIFVAPPDQRPTIGIKRSDMLEYGPRGSRIQGSKLLRDYCVYCGQAMRVLDAGITNTCLDCRPTGIPGTRTSSNATPGEIQYHGGRFNKAEW